MRLAVMERVLLGNMLEVEVGNFTTLKLVREARESLSFTKEEINELQFVQDGKNLKWDAEAALELGEIEILLNDVVDIIKRMLTTLNDQAKLTDQHFSLYEKFIVNGGPKIVN